MNNGGKGSAPRPFSVTNEEYAARWDAIFGRDKPKQEAYSCPLCQRLGSCPPEAYCPGNSRKFEIGKTENL